MKLPIDRIEYRDGGIWLHLENRAAARKTVYELSPKISRGIKHDLEIKQHRERRSRDANSYFWQLCGKLAATINVPKEEIYREQIKNIGDNFDIVCVKEAAVKNLCEGWAHNGLGWVAEPTGSSKIPGCENVILYYGSSTYNTRQMSLLIDRIVQECEEQGISTMTPERLSLLKEDWAVAQAYKEARDTSEG